MAVSRLEDSDADAILPVSIGTGVWAAVLVTLLVARATLAANGATWWITSAAVGLVSGLGGLVFLTWRKRRSSRPPTQE